MIVFVEKNTFDKTPKIMLHIRKSFTILPFDNTLGPLNTVSPLEPSFCLHYLLCPAGAMRRCLAVPPHSSPVQLCPAAAVVRVDKK